jgi:hypothetical protein
MAKPVVAESFSTSSWTYKGYIIHKDISSGDMWITKGGRSVAKATYMTDAKRTIDALLGESVILRAIRANQPAAATNAITTILQQKMTEALARERWQLRTG